MRQYINLDDGRRIAIRRPYPPVPEGWEVDEVTGTSGAIAPIVRCSKLDTSVRQVACCKLRVRWCNVHKKQVTYTECLACTLKP
jgi:hypothetical protein